MSLNLSEICRLLLNVSPVCDSKSAMASLFVTCLVVQVICEGTSGQKPTTSTYITVDNGTESLTDYLCNVNQAFFFYNTGVQESMTCVGHGHQRCD